MQGFSGAGLGVGAVHFITFLIPGLLGLMLIEAIAELRKVDNLNRIFIALFLTVISNLLAELWIDLPEIKIEDSQILFYDPKNITIKYIVTSCIFSSFFSLIFSFLHNRDVFYSILRSVRLTAKSGRIDVWHEAFTSNQGNWLEVEFKDGRKLIGWPKFYSVREGERQLFIADATWHLIDTNGLPDQADVIGTGVYISNFDEVLTISFLNGTEENDVGQT